MKYNITKITYDSQHNIALVTTEDGKPVAVEYYPGSEEPCNIGTSDHIGYVLHGHVMQDNGIAPCVIEFDFGTVVQDSLDLYDWRLESDDTEARLIVYA